jgi:hypothetical protein
MGVYKVCLENAEGRLSPISCDLHTYKEALAWARDFSDSIKDNFKPDQHLRIVQLSPALDFNTHN